MSNDVGEEDQVLVRKVTPARDVVLQIWQGRRLFSDAEIDTVARRLEAEAERAPSDADAATGFRLKDLQIGDPRPEPLWDAQGSNNALEHFDETTQELAFRFIKSDARIEQKLRRPLAWIQLDGVRRTFYAYQVYLAFLMLVEERGSRRGMIVADEQGLGKTTEVLLYILFNYLLVENRRHCNAHPQRHLGPADDPNSRCPSAHLWPIVCWCEQNVTRELSLSPRSGATLLFVPKNLLPTWKAEWTALGVQTSKYALHLFVHHSRSPSSRYVGGEYRADLCLVQHDTGAWCPRDASRAHSVIVATTPGSYPRHVLSYFRRSRRVSQADGSLSGSTGYDDGLAWARVIYDEAHRGLSEETIATAILRSLSQKQGEPPNFAFLTGTPELRNGIADALPLVEIINAASPSIGRHDLCRKFASHANLQTIRNTQRKLQRRSLDRDKRTAFAATVAALRVAYMVKRTQESIQNGKPLTQVPPLELFDVWCTSPSRHTKIPIAEVESHVKKSLLNAWPPGTSGPTTSITMEELLRVAVRARMIATVPGLARFPPEKLTIECIKKELRHRRGRSGRLYKHFVELYEGSAKLQVLASIIDRLGTDAEGEPEHLVVLSEFPVICECVQMLCLEKDIKSRWVDSTTDLAERGRIVETFQTGTKLRPREHRPRVLIGTVDVLGFGVTLGKSARLVLMEPSHHRAVEAQAAKRVNRIGSRSDRCCFYRLTNPDSAVEKLLVASQDRQARFGDLVSRFLYGAQP
ncbi:hypothetical protein A1O7_06959 [Cladophialophora yegresii CBS 114405]|uniref:Helicase ATP-binding domain-containing protein n=1 Tax=Cladophialophora yegresii CBS 114405 TaxID=1182544 RepID=W9VUB8_9EURO|nr:uncharacterized protein A1O7_06959 [Cladophialophora yegresii CBS 114405]EXJ56615.1 hypothetical protein A1O7_06959 [Cladophialophora yegresii CBS 114405]